MGKAPPAILNLVERFARNIEFYRAAGYNEAQVRRSSSIRCSRRSAGTCITAQGYADAYKEVIHEDAIKIGGATKAPDYCFRVGGARKFFVEAKKPSVDIARRRRRLPVATLRLVGQAAALDPDRLRGVRRLRLPGQAEQDDKASKARIYYLKYTEYPDRWDESSMSSRGGHPSRFVRQVRRSRSGKSGTPKSMPRS